MIREIQEKDNKEVGKLVQTLLEVHGLNLPGTAYYDPNLFELYDYYQKPRSRYWVIEKEGKIIGGAGVAPFNESESIAELQKLYILPDYQGNGYSHELMQKCMAFAKEEFDSIYLETFASLKAANQLYEKYGFRRLGKPLEGTEHGTCDTWFLKEFYRG